MPGIQELLVIGVIAVLVFGPDRLPELARNLGRWVGRFRMETQRNVDELKQMGEIQELQSELSSLRRDLERTRRGVGLEASPPTRRAGSSRNTAGGRRTRGAGYRLQGTPQRASANGGLGDGNGSSSGFGAGMAGPMLGLRPDDAPAPFDLDAT